MYITWKKSLLSLIAVLFLASCANEKVVEHPPISFTRYMPIFLNVASIQYMDEYKSPLRPPYVEHLLPYSPAEAVRIWVKDRIRAVGPDKSLHVIIKNASVKASVLHKDNSIEDFFTIDQDKRYDAELDLELRIYGPNSALSEASITVSVRRPISLSENASAYRRNSAFREMIGSMMEAANAELEKNIFQYMGGHINYSQNP